MFVKADNQLPDHPKVLAAGYKAAWLFFCGLCYSSRMLTDGFIPTAQVPRLAVMPGWRKAAVRLVEVGLWTMRDGGYQIHDYLDYQEARADVERRRQNDRQRKLPDMESANLPLHSLKNSSRIPDGIPVEARRNPRGFRVPDRDGDQDTDLISAAAVTAAHTPEKHETETTAVPLEASPIAATEVPARMAASCAAIAERARLASPDDADLARVVQLHLEMWPEDVLADHAERFDRWARQKEGKGERIERSVATLDTFFSHIRPDSKRKRSRGARASPATLFTATPVLMSADEPPDALADVTEVEQVTPRRQKRNWSLPRHGTRCRCTTCMAVERILRHPAHCMCHECIELGYYKGLALHAAAQSTGGGTS